MTASPAADWLPFDLEAARREPERVRTVVFPDARCIAIHSGETEVIEFDNDWKYLTFASALRLAPLPAQPAECSRSHPHEKVSAACERKTEQARVDHAKRVAVLADEWHPTSQLPDEGRVVEFRFVDGRTCETLPSGRIVNGEWEYSSLRGAFIISKPELIAKREWRYPPGARAEATINAAGQDGVAPAKPDFVSESGLMGHTSGRPTPVPAAPQRQNLAMWLWIKGRGPAPESKRVTLPGLPVSSFNVLGK